MGLAMDDQARGAAEQDEATAEAEKSRPAGADATAAGATSNWESSREELIRTKNELEEEQIHAREDDQQSPF